MYPTWHKGKQVGQHRRDFAGRYEAIRDWLKANGFDHFTVLDFGAGGGYFTARLTEDFGAESTAVEKDPRARNPLARAKAAKVINEHVDAERLKELGRFDVILALNVLHHLSDWREYLDVLAANASVLFIEVANPNEVLPNAAAHTESRDIEAEVNDLGAQPVHRSPGYHVKFQRTLYVLDKRYDGDDEVPYDPAQDEALNPTPGAELDEPDPQPEGEPAGEVTQVEAEPSQPKPKRKPRKQTATELPSTPAGGEDTPFMGSQLPT